MKLLQVSILSLGIILSPGISSADRVDVPIKFYEHGLIEDAKREFLIISLDRRANDDERAKSLSYLGDIAFDQRNISLAMKTWQELIDTYPSTISAGLVQKRIEQLGELVEATTGDTLDNATAQSYVRHGDWWSRGKEETLTIDTSWIPRDQVALGWYDRVIKEFPNSDASLLALKKKFYTMYGWETGGRNNVKFGVRGTTPIFELVEVFDAIQAASPNDPDLQRFRFMIAQSYWIRRDFKLTREWLKKVVDSEEGRGGFYKDLAVWRLKKVEY